MSTQTKTSELFLHSVDDTEAFGGLIASCAQRGDTIFLHGNLGSGKTAFSRGYIRYFFQNCRLDVPSPSYLLHFVYQQDAPEEAKTMVEKETNIEVSNVTDNSTDTVSKPGPAKAVAFKASRFAQISDCPVHHFDPYRLKPGKIAALVDFQKIFKSEISLIEWPEKLGSNVEIPKTILHIYLDGVGIQNDSRKCRLEMIGERWCKEKVLNGYGGLNGDFNLESSLAKFKESVKVVLYQNQNSDNDSESLSNGTTNNNVNNNPNGTNKEFSNDSFYQQRYKMGTKNGEKLYVLGIESSCDDTGAAVVCAEIQKDEDIDNKESKPIIKPCSSKILGECTASQAGIHEEFGGVKPDAAMKGHKDAINRTVDEAIEKSGVKMEELSAIAVTVGPGLSLCLSVGVEKAVYLAAKYQKPLVKIHHMEAHAMMTRMSLPDPKILREQNKEVYSKEAIPDFPYLTLLVSGGHNMVVLTEGLGKHRILGSTLDDSVGEAFDKTSRLLGIKQIPGGPHLEKMAKNGNDKKYNLPKPLAASRDLKLKNGCDFSYSGLKTGIKALIEKELPNLQELTDALEDGQELPIEIQQKKSDIAACFQRVAVNHLVERSSRAITRADEYLKKTYGDDTTFLINTIIVAGGVAANSLVRLSLQKLAEEHGLRMLVPHPKYCVDNGVMVAWTGLERIREGLWDYPPSRESISESSQGTITNYFVEVLPKWPLGVRDEGSSNYKNEISEKMKNKNQNQNQKQELNLNCITQAVEDSNVTSSDQTPSTSTSAAPAEKSSTVGNTISITSNSLKRPADSTTDFESSELSKNQQKKLAKRQMLEERKLENQKRKDENTVDTMNTNSAKLDNA